MKMWVGNLSMIVSGAYPIVEFFLIFDWGNPSKPPLPIEGRPSAGVWDGIRRNEMKTYYGKK